MHYMGWVPTAGGRLSFSMIGRLPHIKSDFSNEVHEGVRWIVCHQVREHTDIPLPYAWLQRGVARLFFQVDLRIHCVLACKESRDGELRGRVFLFDQERWGSSEQLLFHDAERSVAGLAGKPGNVVPTLIEGLSTSALYHAEFCLERPGFCSVSGIKYNSETFSCHGLEAGLGMPVSTDRYSAAQCYYFIKDLAHYHRNHSRHNDTLTTLHPVGDDPVDWCRQTLKALYRAMVSQRRDKTPFGVSCAKGMLAYIDSFICVCTARYGDSFTEMPLRDNALLKEALNAEAEAANVHSKFRELWSPSNFIFRILLPVFATLVGLFAIFRFVHGPPVRNDDAGPHDFLSSSPLAEHLEWAVSLVADKPGAAFVTALVLIFFVRSLDKRALSGARGGRFALRFFLGMRRVRAFCIASLLGVVTCLLLVVYLRAMFGFLS